MSPESRINHCVGNAIEDQAESKEIQRERLKRYAEEPKASSLLGDDVLEGIELGDSRSTV